MHNRACLRWHAPGVGFDACVSELHTPTWGEGKRFADKEFAPTRPCRSQQPAAVDPDALSHSLVEAELIDVSLSDHESSLANQKVCSYVARFARHSSNRRRRMHRVNV
eukprot:3873678-Pleurochrysis_carterae.AAC.4